MPGYSTSLQHVSTPFEMAIPSSLLYTSPPLLDRTQLPPPESDFDVELRRTAARTNDGNSNKILSSIEAKAEALASNSMDGVEEGGEGARAGLLTEPVHGPPDPANDEGVHPRGSQ